MGCSEDMYHLKKESKSLNVVTHHPMEDTIGIPITCKDLAEWILLANHV
jgi:hypothetical protein